MGRRREREREVESVRLIQRNGERKGDNRVIERETKGRDRDKRECERRVRERRRERSVRDRYRERE